MRVKRLKLNSFRGIRKETINFEDNQPTIFIGVNGIGKSSILDNVSLLLSWIVARIQNQKGNGRFFKDEDITGNDKEVLSEITIVDADSKEITWSLSHTRKGNRKNTSSELSQLRDFTTRVQNQLDENPSTSLPVFVYYPTNRAVIDIPLRIRKKHNFDEQISAYDRALTGGQIAFRDFFEWFRQREDLENELRVHGQPQYQDRQLQAVREAYGKFLDNFSNLRVRRTSPIRMTVDKQGVTLAINQLSDGEKCLLAMVGDLARRLAIANPSQSNSLDGKGIILIDEIELHLHPKWQSCIIDRLTQTFRNCQFIVTTHSPLVITNTEWISLLQYTSQGIVCERVRSYGKDVNRILATLMESPERQIDIQNELSNLFKLIDENKLEEARNLRQEIATQLQEEDPKLVRADWLIQRKAIMQK